ncbi:MAG: cupin domain-containing protein [Christensenellaceae bacterium]
MILKKDDSNYIRIEHLQMGEGHFISRPKIVLEDIPVTIHYETIESGCSIGKHYHSEETEYYYMLEGEGVYNDNGELTILRAGDVAICGGGEFHSIRNERQAPIVFLGIISQH